MSFLSFCLKFCFFSLNIYIYIMFKDKMTLFKILDHFLKKSYTNNVITYVLIKLVFFFIMFHLFQYPFQLEHIFFCQKKLIFFIYVV
uniref:Uncharacterized protein n=1 Tax=Pleurastrum terricola TaxID=34116 RepID=A6YG83_PLETE|nr:hypothetical protein LeteCp028 [Pleurastrum terricola]ABO69358.1 hypothetical protein [Pleurastrum terricola]